MADPRIASLDLDEKTVLRRSPEIEHERAVAVYDPEIIADDRPQPGLARERIGGRARAAPQPSSQAAPQAAPQTTPQTTPALDSGQAQSLKPPAGSETTSPKRAAPNHANGTTQPKTHPKGTP